MDDLLRARAAMLLARIASNATVTADLAVPARVTALTNIARAAAAAGNAACLDALVRCLAVGVAVRRAGAGAGRVRTLPGASRASACHRTRPP